MSFHFDPKELLPGDILLIGSRLDPLAWAIQHWSPVPCPWNHAALVGSPDRIFEACPSGLKASPITNYGGWRYEVDAFRVKDATHEMVGKCLHRAYMLLDEKPGYDWRGMIGYLARTFGLWFRTNWFDSPTDLVCIEFVAECWYAAGVYLADYGPDLITLGDVGYSDEVYRLGKT